jgi:hypothetical protein
MIRDAVKPEPWVEAERYYNSLPEPKTEYTVHFHIHMGYDITVEADSEEEAIELAEEMFEDVEIEDFDFIDSTCEGII